MRERMSGGPIETCREVENTDLSMRGLRRHESVLRAFAMNRTSG
jgi:hypothetical protein